MKTIQTDIADEKDGLEVVFQFLLNNWHILVILPVVGVLAAFVALQTVPPTYTSSIILPAPSYPLPVFDEMAKAGADHRDLAVVLTEDNGVILQTSSASADEVRATAQFALNAAQAFAASTYKDAEKRYALAAQLEARLTLQATQSTDDKLSENAIALAAVQQQLSVMTDKMNFIGKWSRQIATQSVAVSSSNSTGKFVPLAAFAGFTVAVIISLALQFFRRPRGSKTAP